MGTVGCWSYFLLRDMGELWLTLPQRVNFGTSLILSASLLASLLETGSHYVAQAGLELTMHVAQAASAS